MNIGLHATWLNWENLGAFAPFSNNIIARIIVITKILITCLWNHCWDRVQFKWVCKPVCPRYLRQYCNLIVVVGTISSAMHHIQNNNLQKTQRAMAHVNVRSIRGVNLDQSWVLLKLCSVASLSQLNCVLPYTRKKVTVWAWSFAFLWCPSDHCNFVLHWSLKKTKFGIYWTKFLDLFLDFFVKATCFVRYSVEFWNFDVHTYKN